MGVLKAADNAAAAPRVREGEKEEQSGDEGPEDGDEHAPPCLSPFRIERLAEIFRDENEGHNHHSHQRSDDQRQNEVNLFLVPLRELADALL